MLIDLTIKITQDISSKVSTNLDASLIGHLGTHFDVMDKEFPLEFVKREGIVFDVKDINSRDIEKSDIDMSLVKKDMFVAFYTGCVEEKSYGTKEYFQNHHQLSGELIDELLKKQVSIIGIDASGIRMGKEHKPADQLCADNNVFVVENLINLDEILKYSKKFIANTYPLNFSNSTGLPCRVVAEINV